MSSTCARAEKKGKLDIFDSNVRDDPIAHQAQQRFSDIAAVKHMLIQSSKFSADVPVLNNMLVKLGVGTLPEQIFFAAEMLVDVLVERAESVKRCGVTVSLAYPQLKVIKTLDQLLVLLVDFLDAGEWKGHCR
jgi:hypothetical protein